SGASGAAVSIVGTARSPWTGAGWSAVAASSTGAACVARNNATGQFERSLVVNSSAGQTVQAHKAGVAVAWTLVTGGKAATIVVTVGALATGCTGGPGRSASALNV